MNTQQCLNEETLASYLEGLLDPALRAAAEQHLVGCDECRSQLAFYMRILDETVLKEEDSVVEEAISRWPERPAPEKSGWVARGWIGLAASLLLVVSLGVFLGLDRPDAETPEAMAKDLLENYRPFEARLSGQQYLARVVTRSSANSDFPVEAAVAAQLRRMGATNHISGIGFLLAGDFDEAIRHLELAVTQTPDEPAIRNDLGVAYLERHAETRAELDDNLQKAQREFEAAIGLEFSFVPSVYNSVLLYERRGLPGMTRSFSERYLSLDSESDWATEIQTRMEGSN